MLDHLKYDQEHLHEFCFILKSKTMEADREHF